MYKEKLFRKSGSFELAHPVSGPGSPGSRHSVPSGRPFPAGPTLTPGSTVVVTHAADVPGLIVNGRHASGSATCNLKGVSKVQLDIAYWELLLILYTHYVMEGYYGISAPDVKARLNLHKSKQKPSVLLLCIC